MIGNRNAVWVKQDVLSTIHACYVLEMCIAGVCLTLLSSYQGRTHDSLRNDPWSAGTTQDDGNSSEGLETQTCTSRTKKCPAHE